MHAHPSCTESAPVRRAENPWIVGRVAPPRPRLRLFCLPQAGGSAASFAPWRLAAPPGVELATVELPGRGARGGEPLPDSVEALADAVLDGISEEFDLPYAFFGHSFGALVCYELVVRIRRRGLPPPRALLVSASRAPFTPVRTRVSHLDDRGLLDWLDGFGGMPPTMTRYPQYLRYALDAVRRDLALAEAYPPVEPEPVGCPLHAFGGAGDPLVSGAHLEAWRACAAGEFTTRLLPGGHDYLFTGAPAVLGALTTTLG
ncbi:thioesterase II family protein [Streptomyces hiroshimensis]|uniref:Thioesterase n=1 Tax=Streptomyces hiroshimensis TaxID=66424 RepID=A0ABQ2Y4P2_9ACTN|nr:thioesterase domain-containing protein [Streptomyces hiroshimensis]GGX62101.1 thioesterase [Streptomyces hiroshimensis]